MSFKKNNPGCPCRCGDEPPTGPCGCNETLTISITNAQTLWEVIFVRFSPGPCDYLQFTGIDAIEGDYEITLGSSSQEYELIRVAATNNPLADFFGNEYCLFVRLRVEYLGDPACEIAFFLDWKVELLGGGDCTPLEDVDFTTSTNSWSFTNDNIDPYIASCTEDSGMASVLTYTDALAECADKYYMFDWSLAYG